MSDQKTQSDHETVMMALDQISQTIDVMTRVVNRLRTHLEHQHKIANKKAESADRDSENQTLH